MTPRGLFHVTPSSQEGDVALPHPAELGCTGRRESRQAAECAFPLQGCQTWPL